MEAWWLWSHCAWDSIFISGTSLIIAALLYNKYLTIYVAIIDMAGCDTIPIQLLSLRIRTVHTDS